MFKTGYTGLHGFGYDHHFFRSPSCAGYSREETTKVITVKVDMDGDGNSLTIDTTIIIDENFNIDEFKEAMKEYEVQVINMEKCLKEMDQYHKQGNMFFYGEPDMHREMVRVRPPKSGESLSDVLGDIPMRAVTSYKIKETKNGKRITIEVSDDVMDDLHEDILIWTGDVAAPPPPPKMRKEVFIEKKVEKEE